MIIKSMSRKTKSFSQLFSYMEKGSSKSSEYDFFSQNLYSNNDKEIKSAFLENARELKFRRNGNYLFHEVISITKSKQLNLEQEKERLFDIVCQYTKSRCCNNLAVGYLHDEKSNNIHYHLMISSNEVGSNRNQRLTKHNFDKIKKETEKYVIDKYPELEQDIIINGKKERKKQKLSKGAWEVKRKGGRLEKKERITSTLKDIFSGSNSKSEFFNQLSSQHIEMYNRGKSIGFISINDQKKYRLKTLGLETEFHGMNIFTKSEAKNTKVNEPRGKTEKSPHQTEIEKRQAEIKKSREQFQSSSKNNTKGMDK